jgi:hypothetical protein
MSPGAAYTQVIKGVPAKDYTVDELVYRPRNVRTNRVYGYGHVEQIIMTVNIAIRRQIHQLSYYTDGSIPDLIFQVPETWNPLQIQQFSEYWDALLSGNSAEKRKAKFVPGGIAPYDVKQHALKDAFDEWLARVICYKFSQSPTPFVNQQNRSTSEQQHEQAVEEGLIPDEMWISNTVNLLMWRYLDASGYEHTFEQEETIDALIQAQIDQIYINAKVQSPKQVAEERGIEYDETLKDEPAPGKPVDDVTPPVGGGEEPSEKG